MDEFTDKYIYKLLTVIVSVMPIKRMKDGENVLTFLRKVSVEGTETKTRVEFICEHADTFHVNELIQLTQKQTLKLLDLFIDDDTLRAMVAKLYPTGIDEDPSPEIFKRAEELLNCYFTNWLKEALEGEGIKH